MKKFQLIIICFLGTTIYCASFPDKLIDHDNSIQISKININIDITGGIAETTVDLTYFNPSDKFSEITLDYPVNAGQRLINFSSGITSPILKPSVKVTNKSSDNCDLLTLNNENLLFKIVSIPPNGYKKISFKIQEEMTLKNQKYSYFFPFTYEKSIPDFNICATVFSEKFFDGSWDSETLIDYHKYNYYLDKPINLLIPEKGFNLWIDSNYFYTNTYIEDGYKLTGFKTEGISEAFLGHNEQSNALNFTGLLKEGSGKIILQLQDRDGKESEKEIIVKPGRKNGPLEIKKMWAYKKIDYLRSLNKDIRKGVDEVSIKYALYIPEFIYTVKNKKEL